MNGLVFVKANVSDTIQFNLSEAKPIQALFLLCQHFNFDTHQMIFCFSIFFSFSFAYDGKKLEQISKANRIWYVIRLFILLWREFDEGKKRISFNTIRDPFVIPGEIWSEHLLIQHNEEKNTN